MSPSGILGPRYQDMVVGYGNSLRRDDGTGRRVAEEVASWQLPGVAVRSIHQLVPELVEDLIQTARIIFVDASANERDVQLREIDAHQGLYALNHTFDPCGLLALVAAVYGHGPQGWLLTIPGSDFGIGEDFSVGAQRNMAKAIALVRDFLRGAK